MALAVCLKHSQKQLSNPYRTQKANRREHTFRVCSCPLVWLLPNVPSQLQRSVSWPLRARMVLLESELYWWVVGLRAERVTKRSQTEPGKAYSKPRYETHEAHDAKLRRQLGYVIGIGDNLRANVVSFRGLGQKYKRISDPAVSGEARKLYRNCDDALLVLDYLEAGLMVRLQLRRIWNRDSSDLVEFWKRRFESIYSSLEDATRELAFLVEPELSERFAKRLVAQRPLLTLPRNAEDSARVALQRFKKMMWTVVPMNHDLRDLRQLAKLAGAEGEELTERVEKKSAEEEGKDKGGPSADCRPSPRGRA